MNEQMRMTVTDGETKLDWEACGDGGVLKSFDDDSVIPLEALPEPERFHMVVKPTGIRKKSKGGILFTDHTVSDQEWTHGIAMVCILGPSVFAGKRFEDLGLSRSNAPKVGDLVYVHARSPLRFKCDGELYLIVGDDTILGRFNKEHVHRISFTIG